MEGRKKKEERRIQCVVLRVCMNTPDTYDYLESPEKGFFCFIRIFLYKIFCVKAEVLENADGCLW